LERQREEVVLEVSMQDAEIIEKIRSGETDAWQLLFDKYVGTLLYIGKSYGLVKADADEVANDVFLSAFTLFREGKLGPNIGPWLRKVMKNRAIDRSRENKQELDNEPFEDGRHWIDNQRGGSLRPKEDRLNLKRAWRHFMKHSPRTESPSTDANDTDILHWIANHVTNEDLADYLTINPDAARQRKHRALDRLKRKMKDVARSTSGCEVANNGK
jgi:DNA-directed RNA polymerase specialized sigma24 family protein